jgi:flagellar hook assembly protein FlgD
MTGKRIRTLDRGIREPGRYTARWDGRDDSGGSTVSGLYFCKMKAGNFTGIIKLIYLK